MLETARRWKEGGLLVLFFLFDGVTVLSIATTLNFIIAIENEGLWSLRVLPSKQIQVFLVIKLTDGILSNLRMILKELSHAAAVGPVTVLCLRRTRMRAVLKKT